MKTRPNEPSVPTIRLAVLAYAAKHRLSSREEQLLTLAVVGRTVQQAADELHLSPNTVATYWQRIYQKTGHRPQSEVLAHLLRCVLDGAEQDPSTNSSRSSFSPASVINGVPSGGKVPAN